jgi:hypothetical protein
MCAGLCPQAALSPAEQTAAPALSGEKARVRLVFSHPAAGIEGWPNLGYDSEARKAELASGPPKRMPDY